MGSTHQPVIPNAKDEGRLLSFTKQANRSVINMDEEGRLLKELLLMNGVNVGYIRKTQIYLVFRSICTNFVP